MRIKILIMFGIMLFLVGCGAPQPAAETTPATPACESKDCFAEIANTCGDISITVTEDFGTLTYASNGCVFTKTLVNTTGPEEVRKVLEGKSLTCKYEQGKFDQRWIDSIVYGIEYCEGELKDRIVDLMAFV